MDRLFLVHCFPFPVSRRRLFPLRVSSSCFQFPSQTSQDTNSMCPHRRCLRPASRLSHLLLRSPANESGTAPKGMPRSSLAPYDMRLGLQGPPIYVRHRQSKPTNTGQDFRTALGAFKFCLPSCPSCLSLLVANWQSALVVVVVSCCLQQSHRQASLIPHLAPRPLVPCTARQVEAENIGCTWTNSVGLHREPGGGTNSTLSVVSGR
jgi:hypothetical protein